MGNAFTDLEDGRRVATSAQISDANPATEAQGAALVEPSPSRIPFGPYAGMSVAELAVVDPAYLFDWIREGIGDAELRAEAARALALREPQRSARLRIRPRSVAGLAGLLVLLLFARGAMRLVEDPTAFDPTRTGASLGSAALGAGAGSGSGSGSRSGSTTGAGASKGEGEGAASRDGTQRGRADDSGESRPGDASGRDASAPAKADPSIDYDAPCGARVPGAIPADSAGDFLDSFQAVEFEVLRGKDTGKVTFLNSHDPYQGHFYVAIFPSDYAAFGGAPAQRFKGRCIVVQGLIETYRGSPQIVLRDAADLRVVERDADDGP